MNFKFALFFGLTVAIATPALAQKAVEAPGGKYAKEADQMFRASFKAENPKYWMTRLDQDETMKTCQQYRDNPPRKVGEKLEKLNAATIRYPVEGKLIGDWREGEKLAAVGTGGHIGFLQPDPAGKLRGGNCYACHELAKKEIAYGTIGPSLRNFGKIRGNSEETIKYVYDKVYNSNAFTACTNMPRFGLHNWVTPEQITHIVAFLVDPESPVNKD
ncbi:MAG: sulfur oxidation c-type cytochrome SoxX [Azonexus sp.]